MRTWYIVQNEVSAKGIFSDALENETTWQFCGSHRSLVSAKKSLEKIRRSLDNYELIRGETIGRLRIIKEVTTIVVKAAARPNPKKPGQLYKACFKCHAFINEPCSGPSHIRKYSRK